MAYARGRLYAWSDGKRIHLWAEDGIDGMKDAGWYASRRNPSGVALALKDFDELVVMRYAELTEKGLVKATKRALRKHAGNGGCRALEDSFR